MKKATNLPEQSTRRNKFENRIKDTVSFTKSIVFLTKKIFML